MVAAGILSSGLPSRTPTACSQMQQLLVAAAFLCPLLRRAHPIQVGKLYVRYHLPSIPDFAWKPPMMQLALQLQMQSFWSDNWAFTWSGRNNNLRYKHSLWCDQLLTGRNQRLASRWVKVLCKGVRRSKRSKLPGLLQLWVWQSVLHTLCRALLLRRVIVITDDCRCCISFSWAGEA